MTQIRSHRATRGEGIDEQLITLLLCLDLRLGFLLFWNPAISRPNIGTSNGIHRWSP
jgi:hypothetical protein